MRLTRPRRPDTLIAVVAGIAVLLIAVGLVAARVATAPSDRVPAGVTIAGVAVGGLSADEAERAVRAGAPDPPGTVEVALDGEPGFPIIVPVGDLGPVPRARLAVREALKQPSLWARVRAEIGFPEDREVDLRYRVTSDRARELVGQVTARIDTPGRAARVGVGGGRVVVSPARAGRAVDTAALERRLGSLAPRVEVPVTVVEPAISDAQAQAARTEALRLTARRARVVGAGRTATVTRDVMLAALRFPVEAGTIDVRLDPATLAAAVAPAYEGVLTPPVSAGFAVTGETVAVTPSREGRELDAATLATRFERRTGARPVRVAVRSLPPARTTADARALRIREQVSEFRTPYTCCAPRVTNIRRAAAILDGTVIPPGGTFSLNEVLGERTAERGFVPAPQINAGELEDAIGGGVSQVSTTTFNAAFFAGMRIVTHTPHEFWITRYPPGREATVSWGGPEMIFENDWDAGLLVTAAADDTGITVRMYSSPLGRRITTETIGDAVEGTAFSVAYTRRVWAGDTVKRDERYTWTYKAPPASE